MSEPTLTLDELRAAVADPAPEDQPFELYRDFNGIFVAVGAALLGESSGGSNGPAQGPAWGLHAVAVSWRLAEFLTRRRRVIAPSLIVVLGTAWAGLRGRLMRTLTAFPGKGSLPPCAEAAP